MPAVISALSIAAIDDAASPVIVHVDMTAPTAVSVVDVTDAALSGAAVADVLACEYSTNNTTWTRLGPAMTLGGGVRSRRFAAPPGAPVSARYWRLVIADLPGADGRSLTIATVTFRAETATLSAARAAPHFVGDTDAYVHMLSDLTAEVYSRGIWQASVETPITAGLLGRADWTQSIDTLLLFHNAIPPHRLFRQGEAGEWDSRPQAFTNIPQVEFPGATYTNGVNEVQQITFDDFLNGETFTMTLDGESTSSIVYSTTPATLAASMKAALEALDAMEGGTVTVANTTGSTYSITFNGGTAAATNWPQMSGSVVSSVNGVISWATLTEGKPGGEPIMSDTRGWPRSGVFWQQRLILVGLKSAPQTGIASVLGQYFNFSAPGRRATDGVEFTIDANDTSGIRQIIAARYLQLFSATGEFHLTVDTLAGDDANPVVQDHAAGLQAAIRPDLLDGATIYVQNGGKAVRELSYVEGNQGYASADISVRAPFLIRQPVDAFVQNSGPTTATGRYHLIRADGQMPVFHSLRSQEFAAWSRYLTDGRIIAGASEESGPSYLIVDREIDGETVRCVEGLDPTRLLDSSVLVELEDEAATIGNLHHLEGCETVWAIGPTEGGGWFHGPYTVTDGELVRDGLPPLDPGTYEVGRWFDAWVDTMDFRIDTQAGSIADLPKRVVAANVSLINSCPPDLVYCGRTYRLPAQRFGEPILDTPPMADAVSGRGTGRFRVRGLQGWTRSASIRLRRSVPGPLHIRAIGLEVAF